MTDIKYTIEPDDIEWEMDWSYRNTDGSRKYPDKPEKEIIFESEGALALMLLNDVIFTNCHWWKDSWPEEAQNITYLGVECNDVFAWGCSDSEELQYKDIKSVYQMWIKDPGWGAQIWCIIKRRQMPQRPVEKSIREAGIWDLDALKAEHNLRPNCYDGISKLTAHRKYDAYCAWEASNGRVPRPFDVNWWDGWREYTTANPDWCSDQWKADEKAACDKWEKENGYE